MYEYNKVWIHRWVNPPYHCLYASDYQSCPSYIQILFLNQIHQISVKVSCWRILTWGFIYWRNCSAQTGKAKDRKFCKCSYSLLNACVFSQIKTELGEIQREFSLSSIAGHRKLCIIKIQKGWLLNSSEPRSSSQTFLLKRKRFASSIAKLERRWQEQVRKNILNTKGRDVRVGWRRGKRLQSCKRSSLSGARGEQI